MATHSTFYLNAPTLAAATAIYTNSTMTTYAPDGYYSNGVIVRQYVSHVLGAATTCPTCPGGGNYFVEIHSGTLSPLGLGASYGIYYQIDAGPIVLIATKTTDACELISTITVPIGSTIHLSLLSLTTNIKFNASDLDDCSTGGPDYCGQLSTYDVTSTITGTTLVASLTPQVSGGSFIPCF